MVKLSVSIHIRPVRFRGIPRRSAPPSSKPHDAFYTSRNATATRGGVAGSGHAIHPIRLDKGSRNTGFGSLEGLFRLRKSRCKEARRPPPREKDGAVSRRKHPSKDEKLQGSFFPLKYQWLDVVRPCRLPADCRLRPSHPAPPDRLFKASLVRSGTARVSAPFDHGRPENRRTPSRDFPQREIARQAFFMTKTPL